jgi:hypothetical protein
LRISDLQGPLAPGWLVTAGFSGRRRSRHCALALVVRHGPGVRAVAAALLAKGSLSGGEAHRIVDRASWPPAALVMMNGIEYARL